MKETEENDYHSSSRQFELAHLGELRNKLIEIRLANPKEGSKALGRIVYRLGKFRVYDTKNRAIYKIVRERSLDPRIQYMSIKDHSELEVGSLVITHLNLTSSKCEITFPERCDPIKKLVFIGVILMIMERVEADTEMFEEPSPSKKILNSIFGFLTCQN